MTTGNFAIAADGAQLRYALHGTGPTRFALTHSLAMNGAFWSLVIAALGNDVSVLTWDCRGHGASSKPVGPYTVELFADDLATVLDTVGWDQAVCAGASMGGTVTLAFAARHPERVSALGLIDTTASYGADALQAWEDRGSKARAEGLASLTAFQKTRWFSDAWRDANPGIVRQCIETFCANDIDAYVETCLMLGRADVVPALVNMAVPTTILVGEEDFATPLPMAKLMHDGIAGSTLEVIPGARHLTPLECPELVADRLGALAREARA